MTEATQPAWHGLGSVLTFLKRRRRAFTPQRGLPIWSRKVLNISPFNHKSGPTSYVAMLGSEIHPGSLYQPLDLCELQFHQELWEGFLQRTLGDLRGAADEGTSTQKEKREWDLVELGDNRRRLGTRVPYTDIQMSPPRGPSEKPSV